MDANSLWSGSSHSDARDAQPDFLFSACACCTHTAVGSVLHVVLNARYWTCALSGRELVCTRYMKRVWLSPLSALLCCPECGICTAISMECTFALWSGM